jgi:translation initiation factor 3 subunit G
VKAELAKRGAGKVVCRICKGDHFTAKCPYKDSLAGLEQVTGNIPPSLSPRPMCVEESSLDTAVVDDETIPPSGDIGGPSTSGPSASAGVGSGGGGKYVPPSMRSGASARGPGEAMSRPGGARDDLPTLRVSNISEDTQENDLRELFGRFGRVARVYVGRDRETGAGRGFAFVSFEERVHAQKAMERVHGMGYDNLILSVQWSRKWIVPGVPC